MARWVPSGLQATLVTQSVWSVRVVSFSPVWGFQMMQVLSSLVVAMRLPSGCQATPVTQSVWSVRVVIFSLVWGFQMMQVWS